MTTFNERSALGFDDMRAFALNEMKGVHKNMYAKASEHEWGYLNLMSDIMLAGRPKPSRTGSPTLSLSGRRLEFDISGGIAPILYSKKVNHHAVGVENRWFMGGSTDVEQLIDNKVRIWDSWVKPESARYDTQGSLIGGDIGGGAYGASWRNVLDVRVCDLLNRNRGNRPVIHEDEFVDKFSVAGFEVAYGDVDRESSPYAWRFIDQFKLMIDGIVNNPFGRRHIVSAWNIPLIDETVLPPCHSFFQVIVDPSLEPGGPNELTLMLHQRSSDLPVGLPFNILGYSSLLNGIAKVTGSVASRLVMNLGDVHIYASQLPFIRRQFDQAAEFFMNDFSPVSHFDTSNINTLEDLSKELITVSGYDNHGKYIPYPVEV